MKRHILLSALFAVYTVSSAFAQILPSEHLQEFVDKKMEKRGIQFTPTHRLKAKEYEAPKKIGILFFGLAGSAEYLGNSGWYDHWVQISEGAADMAAQSVYDECIGELKTNYAERGVELVTPIEYLDTDAKLEAYLNMEMRIMGMAKMLKGTANPNEMGLPDGYAYIKNSWRSPDIGGRADIAEELKMFGLDGYLSIFVECYGANTVSQIATSLILMADRDYVSKAKKETYQRTDLASKMLPMASTSILAEERDELKKEHGKNHSRDSMIELNDGVIWVDPNVAKVIVYSANLYFPMVK